MPKSITIGTARSKPGKIVYGVFDALPLPTGGSDSLPVIVAQGRNADGPTLWLTANIHGAEYNGTAAIHALITPDLVAQMSGTLVAIPTLNPAGLRTAQRSPYYLHGRDPNRLFPSPTTLQGDHEPFIQSGLEAAYVRLFEHIQATASYLIDLHDYGIESIPFVFRDPVFYHEPRERSSAERLQRTIGEMVQALGLTVINEYASADYLKLNLHRSVSGSVLNTARLPAVTIELGGQQRVCNQRVRAAVQAVHNVMRWAGMLPGTPEPINGVPVIDLGYPVRRTTYPRVPTAGLVQYLVEPGERVAAGTPLARLVDVYGRPVGKDHGLLRADQDGFVIGLFAGIAVFPQDAILGVAVRDTHSLVIRVPASEMDR